MYVLVFKLIAINIVEISREWHNGPCWVHPAGGGAPAVCSCHVAEWYSGSI